MTDSWILGDLIEDANHDYNRDATLRVSNGITAEFAMFFTSKKNTITIECYENNSDKPSYVKVINPI